MRPIVGGTLEDLAYLKQVDFGGRETGTLARPSATFRRALSRLAPLTARCGLRLDF